MDRLLAFIDNTLLPPITRLAELKHLRAIRDGIVAILPLIIAGSFFLLLGQLPVDALSQATLERHPSLARLVCGYLGGASFKKNFCAPPAGAPAGSGSSLDTLLTDPLPPWLARGVHPAAPSAPPGTPAPPLTWGDYPGFQGVILVPFRLTMYLMALFASFGIAYYLARAYKLDGVSAGVLSMAAMALTQIPVFIPPAGGFEPGGWMLVLKPISGGSNLGGQGLLAAILLAFFTVEVIRFCQGRKWRFAMPEGVPESVTNALSALIPGGIVLSFLWLLTDVLRVDLVGTILNLFDPLIRLGDTLWAVLAINLIMQIIWLGGIHGASVVNAVFLTIWMKYFDENAAAAAAGLVLPHVTTLPFYQWFVWIGGSGATLTLVFMMCLSKSSYIRRIGKISLLPGICNINEPVIFGLPIMMNPRLAIPFILAPMITGTVSYLAIHQGWVHGLCAMPPWTLPAPLGAFLATAFDYRAVILVAVNLVLAGLIYWPFFRSFEQSMLDKPDPTTDTSMEGA